jgi:hypothetical protein
VSEVRPDVPYRGFLAERLGLVDAVDHLLNRGAVVLGEATVSLGGVELIYVGLNLLVTSVETLERELEEERQRRGESSHREAGPGLTDALAPVSRTTSRPVGSPFTGQEAGPVGTRSAPSPEILPRPSEGGPERGLAQLVLTLVELLRQVLERQAVRRMEGGRLNDDEIERMGIALMELEAKMAELRDVFGLAPEDLNVDLGPLGKLL